MDPEIIFSTEHFILDNIVHLTEKVGLEMESQIGKLYLKNDKHLYQNFRSFSHLIENVIS